MKDFVEIALGEYWSVQECITLCHRGFCTDVFDSDEKWWYEHGVQ